MPGPLGPGMFHDYGVLVGSEVHSYWGRDLLFRGRNQTCFAEYLIERSAEHLFGFALRFHAGNDVVKPSVQLGYRYPHLREALGANVEHTKPLDFRIPSGTKIVCNRREYGGVCRFRRLQGVFPNSLQFAAQHRESSQGSGERFQLFQVCLEVRTRSREQLTEHL